MTIYEETFLQAYNACFFSIFGHLRAFFKIPLRLIKLFLSNLIKTGVPTIICRVCKTHIGGKFYEK